MNKTIRTALVVVPMLLAYPACAWLVGQRVESAIAQNYRLIEGNPSVRIVRRDYERGLFSARETLTVELFGNIRQAMAANSAIRQLSPEPVRLLLHSRIKHGPFPGLSVFAAAVVDSELLLPDELQRQMANALGDARVLQVHGEYRFDGSGAAILSSPAFSAHWPASDGGGHHLLAWGGLRMSVDFEQGMRHYTVRAEAPKLELEASAGGRLTMAGMRFEGIRQRVFADEPLLYSGVQKLTLARFSVADGEAGSEPLEARRVSYEAELPLRGEFIDLIGRLGSESLFIGGRNYGPAHYDFSLRHLHARTAANFYREMLRLLADLSSPAEPARLFAPLAGPALELLRHAPELSVDRISFSSPHGDAALAARLRLHDPQVRDLSDPRRLLTRLDASAEISLPEGLLAAAAALAPSAAVAGEVPAPVHGEVMRQRLAVLAERGFVVREGSLLRSQLVFSKGRLLANGQAVDPLPVVQAPAGAM